MDYVKIIRDPIHGDVSLSGLEVRLLDTPYMQRLRRIKQNGLCFLAYPAMNSTRFEHCLGVMHLSSLLCNHLGVSEEDTVAVRAAGLLHDVGHTPFSHSTERVLKKHGLHHEELGKDLIRDSEISDILQEYSVDVDVVCDLITGEGSFGQIISSEIDVDKMDYLIRDAYYAGVAYGITDIERIINSLRMRDNELYVDSGGLEAVESLLVNRNLMYQTVYRHHTKRIAESMFTHALDTLINNTGDAFEISRFDDYELVEFMRQTEGYVQEIMKRIDERRLYKNVFKVKIIDIEGDFRNKLSGDSKFLEEKMVSDLGLSFGDLIVDYPEVKMSEFKIKVEDEGVFKAIDEVSPLARSLEESEGEKLSLNVYVKRENVKELADFDFSSFFHLSQTSINSFI